MTGNVIGADAHHGHAPRLVVFHERRKRLLDMLHVGTVVAHEDDEEGRRFPEVFEGDDPSPALGKRTRAPLSPGAASWMSRP